MECNMECAHRFRFIRRLLMAIMLFVSTSQAQVIYWSQSGDGIYRASANGKVQEKAMDWCWHDVVDIVVDTKRERLLTADTRYAAPSGSNYDCVGAIRQGDLNGADFAPLLGDINVVVQAMALDIENDRVFYVGNSIGLWPVVPKVGVVDLDNSNHDALTFNGMVDPVAIAFDTASGYLYFADQGAKRVYRARPEDKSIEGLGIDNSIEPNSIAIDPVDGKLYWSDLGLHRIQRADLNGQNVEDVIVETAEIAEITIDVAARKLYWQQGAMSRRWWLPQESQLFRSNLDGSSIELLGTHGGRIVLIDLPSEVVYVADWLRGETVRSTFDGSIAEPLIVSVAPMGLGFDSVLGHLYWTGFSGVVLFDEPPFHLSAIGKTDFLAHRIILAENLGQFDQIIVNGEIGILSWTTWFPYLDLHYTQGHIYSMGLNKPGLHLVYAPPSDIFLPGRLAVDTVDRKVLWYDVYRPGKLFLSDLDGTNLQLFVDVERYVYSAALDNERRKIYLAGRFGVSAERMVFRLDRDGSNEQMIYTTDCAQSLYELTVDERQGKLYWAQSSANPDCRGVMRANLDGSDVERVLDFSVNRMALDMRVFGDSDGNGAVTLNDVASFMNCFHSDIDLYPACAAFDFDPRSGGIEHRDAKWILAVMDSR